MDTSYYVVRYSGPFGFIKPWTAVRDRLTFSQQFLTPSILEGMRQKLEVSAILRHRLRYLAINEQQEQTQPLGWEVKSKQRMMLRPRSILKRGVMICPSLFLAFGTPEDASKAAEQHLCLCRNEDVILPDGNVQEMTAKAFDLIPGFELLLERGPDSFLVGYNRFNNAEEMYGRLLIIGDPTSDEEYEP